MVVDKPVLIVYNERSSTKNREICHKILYTSSKCPKVTLKGLPVEPRDKVLCLNKPNSKSKIKLVIEKSLKLQKNN